jgi:hypothetical protein
MFHCYHDWKKVESLGNYYIIRRSSLEQAEGSGRQFIDPVETKQLKIWNIAQK